MFEGSGRVIVDTVYGYRQASVPGVVKLPRKWFKAVEAEIGVDGRNHEVAIVTVGGGGDFAIIALWFHDSWVSIGTPDDIEFAA